MLDANLDQRFAAEVARIRQVYSRRTGQDRYSPSEPGHMLAVQERTGRLRAILTDRGYASLADARILEIGCGTGDWLRQFVDWGARPDNLCGIDLIPERINAAKQLCPVGIKLICANAAQIQAPDGAFDLVLQSTVFTSILDSKMREQVAREMLRVLRPQGLILWYDFCVNNPWNPDVRGVSRPEIWQLFPGCDIQLEKVTLAPPLGRPVERVSLFMYRVLSRMKMACTHYLGVISKS